MKQKIAKVVLVVILLGAILLAVAFLVAINAAPPRGGGANPFLC